MHSLACVTLSSASASGFPFTLSPIRSRKERDSSRLVMDLLMGIHRLTKRRG